MKVPAAMKMQPNETLLFVGDSLTDCGRREPEYAPYGRGYVRMFRNLLLQRHPSWRVRVINRGIGGDTIRDLERRWEADVLAERPDRLVVLIGINDVWRNFADPEKLDFHVPLEEYVAIYRELLRVSQESGIQGICMGTPFFVEPDVDEPMRRMCDRYGDAVRDLAEELFLDVVGFQAAIDRLLEEQHPMMIAPDRVHLNPHGHLALAEALYQILCWEG